MEQIENRPPVPFSSISPVPDDDEAVAIMAAAEAVWPRPMIAVAEPETNRSPWRFSGRWWSVPLPVRRDRPWK